MRNTNEVRKDICLDWSLFRMTNSANAKLPGYTEGAEIMRPKIENGQIDSMSGIIYSQIKGLRSNRALRMTVMIPRDGKAKPAIIYFPGGGFTSADHEKFTEMRTALAKAGFVVAAAEYRTVPTKYPALVNDAKAAVRFLLGILRRYCEGLTNRKETRQPERPKTGSGNHLYQTVFHH